MVWVTQRNDKRRGVALRSRTIQMYGASVGLTVHCLFALLEKKWSQRSRSDQYEHGPGLNQTPMYWLTHYYYRIIYLQ